MPPTPPPSHADLVRDANKRRDEEREAKDRQKMIEALEAKEASGVGADRAMASDRMRKEAVQNEVGFENPPFDKRIRVYMPGNKPTTQGYITQDSSTARALNLPRPYRCRFLYNPESLNVNYRTNDQVFPPDAQSADATAALALIPNMQHVSFELFFDRTYEMNTYDAGMSPAHTRALWAGVYADIAALERVVGIQNGQGPILKYPLNLYFGPRVIKKMWGRNSSMGGGKPMQFYGFVDEMSVVYSLFDKGMVPVRARVTLGFTQMVKPEKGGLFLPKIYDVYGPNAGTTEATQ